MASCGPVALIAQSSFRAKAPVCFSPIRAPLIVCGVPSVYGGRAHTLVDVETQSWAKSVKNQLVL